MKKNNNVLPVIVTALIWGIGLLYYRNDNITVFIFLCIGFIAGFITSKFVK